ncbi:MAG: RHH-type transcriptional regulator, proline utilization regulon repressor / proline dehydrogenase [Solirubrobacteraceae bacterium]|nr:RHH-type transcriptional regulator, proline utilization regulon repressor / proline dehydrogenase [Solirubrobacteraceae bacterium]
MTLPAFVNEPLAELRRPAVRAAYLEALGTLDARGPAGISSLVAGDRVGGSERARSTDPGDPGHVVAEHAVARPADARRALVAARTASGDWARRPAAERAEILVGAAALMREDRRELTGLIVRECAKPWVDADAEVAEAIDFLEYYARGAAELGAGRALISPPGERNSMTYSARGVAAVIAPWNFPLAIPTGMTAAALATGNAVVLKPAEQSPACGAAIVAILHRAGVPVGALNLLLGDGEVGRVLVEADVETIAFTGSQAVGLEILRTAAGVEPGQRQLKRVVAELGGKNCVIVDGDADLDEVVPAVIQSAFSYAGQKCSAAARVLVPPSLADELGRRLAGAIDLLVVGQAADFETEVPPLIEAGARERVEGYIEMARATGRVLTGGRDLPGAGHFVAPTLVAGLPDDSPILREEIFGPVLTLETVATLDEAFAIVRESPYGLTAGFFSRHPDHVRRAMAELPVGNLYVNRHITGAVVGRQPFGGNHLSGNGTKAGGPDYLLHFVDPRVTSENTIRHGLVV